jgi:tRNA(fMet)-specific endonuclease VapC
VIHLDTSFLVDLLRESARKKRGRATKFLEEIEEEQLAACVHVQCELYAGTEQSRRPEEERRRVDRLCQGFTIIYPDYRFPYVYARLLATLERTGQRIGNMDLLIATSAVISEAPLVTGNVGEFSRIAGLKLLKY